MKNQRSIFFQLKKNQASATIQLTEELKEHFHTQQRVSLSASKPFSDTIELTVHFQTFAGTLELDASFLCSEEHNQDYQLLHTLTKCSSLPIFIESAPSGFKKEYKATLSVETREFIKTSLGDLRYYNDLNNLKETLMGFPKGFAVPYTNQDTFQLLVKLDEKLFDTIYLSDTESICLMTYTEDQLLVLSVMYDDTLIGSIRFSKQQICDDILEDFEVLLTTNQVSFVLASDNQKKRHYLHLMDSLKQEDVTRITRFLFTGISEQHISS